MAGGAVGGFYSRTHSYGGCGGGAAEHSGGVGGGGGGGGGAGMCAVGTPEITPFSPMADLISLCSKHISGKVFDPAGCQVLALQPGCF